MTANRPSVRLIGDVQAPEFAPATAWLMSNACCELFSDAGVAAAEARHERSVDDPDALVFCLTRPGQIPRAVVEGLHRAFPLARIVALLGPWCEGEVRSGRPWPGVTRIYWHQWQRLIQACAGLRQPGAARLPRSATEVDALLSRTAPQRTNRSALIGVASRRQADFAAIALALDTGGHHAVWLDGAQAVVKLDALVIDSIVAAPDSSELRERFGPVPTLLLGHFPRPDEFAESLAEGLAILAKPYLVSDLLEKLESLLSSRHSAAAEKSAAA